MHDDAPLLRQFLEHRDSLLAFIFARTRDHDAAEEIFQDVGLAIVAEARKGTVADDFLAWGREVARRRIANFYRRRSRRNAHVHTAGSLGEVIDQAFEENRRTLEESRLRYRLLGECLERLSDRSRQVIEQRYRGRSSIAEIAERLSWQPGSVKVALSRARKALGNCIRARLRLMETS